MKDWKTEVLNIIAIVFASLSLGMSIAESKKQNEITELKSELKVKNKQIDGLHKQVSRQTKRIAELTGNGG
ncbi:hypothetical protein A9Q68_10115 [Streptococcus bovimastitidis]|uniref:Phage protein n=1 Tax=Streptococcus bovimastitidis TaxID=1856638 RepID=A0A1L8MK95_9STRE|nr:hypothetical protein [Streptococcus bovimastitidis]OJF71183.1 hypothetical protein A9Q68_10115 [Streptococcus bovimastitidis]